MRNMLIICINRIMRIDLILQTQVTSFGMVYYRRNIKNHFIGFVINCFHLSLILISRWNQFSDNPAIICAIQIQKGNLRWKWEIVVINICDLVEDEIYLISIRCNLLNINV